MKSYVLLLASQLKIEHPKDWYNVSNLQIMKNSEKIPWRNHHELANILTSVYDYSFDPNLFNNLQLKSQNLLKNYVSQLFPEQGNFL